MKIAQNLSLLIVASGVAVAAIRLSVPSHSPAKDTSRSSIAKSDVKTASIEEQIFVTVDDKVQTLFADMSLINRDAKRSNPKSVGPFFGMSRIPQVSTHSMISQQLMKFESAKDFHDTVRAYVREGYEVGVFGYTGYPNKVDGTEMRLRYSDGTMSPLQRWEELEKKDWNEVTQKQYQQWQDQFEKLEAQAKDFAHEASATIAGRHDAIVTKDLGPVMLRAKAIRLDNKECMSCHGDMKLGDPLAVMVYAVQRRERA
ncbi:MAG: hypothetical protein JNJ45_07730 [Chthonomonas sp.]|nr:hypothetical protein [Chthonomonas sp.]